MIVRDTVQQAHQVVDQALSDICSNMHLTHLFQEPEENYNGMQL